MSTEAPTTPAPDAVESFGYKQELSRSLSTADLIIYGLIFMVPIAPFAIFGSVFQASGGMVALTYIVAMAAMMFSANSYAQMAKAFPVSGSVYSYAGRGIATSVGFVSGWMLLLDYIFIPTLLYLASAMAMAAILPAVPVWAWLVFFVLLNTVINYLGIGLTARVNKVMLVLESIVLAIVLAIGIGAVAQGKGTGFSFNAFFNPSTFSVPVILTAVSIAALSFLGFDAISTLAEEHTGTSKALGRSMVYSLLIVGVLFVAQTWVASMLVENPADLLKNGDPSGTAFYSAAGLAGGHWLYVLTAVATAIAWGFADAMVAQAATSRVLFAMARDRQLPKFLRTISPKHKVPVNATLLVAAVSLAFGIYLTILPDGLTVISTLVNFGALTAFLVLNVSVVWHYVVKKKSRRWFVHLVFPVCGVIVLVFVLINARSSAQIVGLIWLAIGIILSIVLARRGISTEIRESKDEVKA